MSTVMPASAWFASAIDEDLQVAEDWFREQGRHDEANRVMAFRRLEPLLRRVAAARDASDRFYEKNGHSFKSRKRAVREEVDAITRTKMTVENELNDLIWEVFGTYVASWHRTRARELGKLSDVEDAQPEEVPDVLF